MASVKDTIPHVVRTANDPRADGLHRALISRIELVNKNIRVIRLSLPDGPVRHLPGQYVDLHIPEIETVGGFTITSPPQTALSPSRPPPKNTDTKKDSQQEYDPHPFIELAIQRSAKNPPAVYLYRPPPEILNTPTSIRIGGSFTYPPFTLSMREFQQIQNVVLIAGGVGINPIMSMISAMDMIGSGRPGGMPQRVRILYSSRRECDSSSTGPKKEEEILFEHRLKRLSDKWTTDKSVDLCYSFYETSSEVAVPHVVDDDNNKNSSSSSSSSNSSSTETVDTKATFRHLHRRMTHQDLLEALGPEQLRTKTLVYVCGIPSMTDEYVGFLRKVDGLDEKRVLCEKWW